ncbi:MAG: SAM-dependent methyltransferase [Pseudotabrizicola sp.]|uniref:class I SAM-dependent methyltransferase n=1 Tax=Pseudotabrizicola sp. TaxID=2939647 RepID=UPI00271F98B5|nr:SAM-dependent methyltransferase [Pseudotabrizicola sp.]MDO8881494.1 SAM-dependent methyltransferase [Pseudotabrizicola sp.]MDP2081718.1 SAM-dependent methyltransferase [Pseudotabrizicola sp.]MDZ7574068.1 SAM-dependent methyltransferase [Pseudotabrizicola sp.]
MTELARLIAARIAATGPITLAAYMAECLLHPDHGYYTTRDPFGAAGDFTTAPEISQMFGELLGLSLAQAWLDQGAPAHFTLAEFGPGRGTLMADVLRATQAVPGFHMGASVVLLEASPALRAAQVARLAPHRVRHIDSPDALPDQPLFLLANEFFDALPIHQFQFDGTAWRERLVGLRDGQMAFGLSDPIHRSFDAPAFQNPVPGRVAEVCPAAQPYAGVIKNRIQAHGGAALIVDYGGWRSGGDTFQAMRAHSFADPLAEPGLADLTAHVDFEALASLCTLPHAYTEQGAFLKHLGIDARATRLAQSLTGAALESHLAAHRRLTHPQEMGSLFKVLGLHGPGTPPPPGFT